LDVGVDLCVLLIVETITAIQDHLFSVRHLTSVAEHYSYFREIQDRSTAAVFATAGFTTKASGREVFEVARYSLFPSVETKKEIFSPVAES